MDNQSQIQGSNPGSLPHPNSKPIDLWLGQGHVYLNLKPLRARKHSALQSATHDGKPTISQTVWMTDQKVPFPLVVEQRWEGAKAFYHLKFATRTLFRG